MEKLAWTEDDVIRLLAMDEIEQLDIVRKLPIYEGGKNTEISPARWLVQAFVFSDTPQGSQYWWKLYGRLQIFMLGECRSVKSE